LRIAINAALLGKRHTGVGTYIVGLIQSLAGLGHEVVVYSSSSLIPSGPGISRELTPRALTFDSGRISGFLRMLWNLFILPMRLSAKDVDAVVSQNAEGSIWCSVPQMLVVHDLIPVFYPEEAPRLRSYYKKLLPHVLKHTAAVIAVSYHTRSDLLQHYKLDPTSVHVAYDGVLQTTEDQSPEYEPVGFPSEPYFLFVGTFSPRKNLETVIRALAEIRDHVRESLLIVAYPDKWTSGYLLLAKELGLCDKIVHMSGLTNREMSFVYSHATALFLLSEYEGFGLPPLEAMRAGAPAVVSDSTALAEVAGDAALKISAHDVDATAETMLRLSTDHTYREELRQLGIQRACTFTWTRTGRTVSDILSQMVQSREGKSRSIGSPR
jgi:glycosyltransferase involved in cell wall biosynthesis